MKICAHQNINLQVEVFDYGWAKVAKQTYFCRNCGAAWIDGFGLHEVTPGDGTCPIIDTNKKELMVVK